MQDPVGLHEISKEFDVATSTASSWTRQHSFPDPLYKLAMGPIWELSAVKAWHAEKYGPKKAPTPVVSGKATLECPTCGSAKLQHAWWQIKGKPHFYLLECERGHVCRVMIRGGDAYDGAWIRLEGVDVAKLESIFEDDGENYAAQARAFYDQMLLEGQIAEQQKDEGTVA